MVVVRLFLAISSQISGEPGKTPKKISGKQGKMPEKISGKPERAFVIY